MARSRSTRANCRPAPPSAVDCRFSVNRSAQLKARRVKTKPQKLFRGCVTKVAIEAFKRLVTANRSPGTVRAAGRLHNSARQARETTMGEPKDNPRLSRHHCHVGVAAESVQVGHDCGIVSVGSRRFLDKIVPRPAPRSTSRLRSVPPSARLSLGLSRAEHFTFPGALITFFVRRIEPGNPGAGGPIEARKMAGCGSGKRCGREEKNNTTMAKDKPHSPVPRAASWPPSALLRRRRRARLARQTFGSIPGDGD